MTHQLKISCDTKDLLHIDELEQFQGQLKSLDDAGLKKLMKSIIKYGFSFPIFVWKKNILDGHQRLAAVKKLIDEGHEIVGGKLPVVKIQARTKKEAAEKLLLINSRYAQIDQSGFDLFTEQFSIDLDEISKLIEIPEINFSISDESDIKDTSKEIDPEDFDGDKICPRCGFEFNE